MTDHSAAAPRKPAHDPEHRGNGAEYHTGEPCIEEGCDKPAGTQWSPHWCQQHNAERLDRISAGLDAALKQYAKAANA